MEIIKEFHVVGKGICYEVKLEEGEVLQEKSIIINGDAKYIVKELQFWRDLNSKGYKTFAFVQRISEVSNET